MKKILSIIVISLVVLLPMGAKAFTATPTCEKSCPTTDGTCTSTCQIAISGNTTTLSTFAATLNLSDGVTLTGITPGDGWTDLTGSTDGSSISLSFMSSGVTTSEFVIATFTLEIESPSTDCTLELVVDGANTTEVTVETTTTTSTGAALPIAIIGCGALAVVVIYSATRKNKKIYKI